MMYNVNGTLSAISAFGTKMDVTANNVANANSDGFKKSRAILTEGSTGSVQAEIDRVDTPGPSVIEVADGEIKERELSNVDLAEEIPGMIPTQTGYDANLATIETYDEMLGNVIDIIG